MHCDALLVRSPQYRMTPRVTATAQRVVSMRTFPSVSSDIYINTYTGVSDKFHCRYRSHYPGQTRRSTFLPARALDAKQHAPMASRMDDAVIQDAIAWCAQHGLVYGAGDASQPELLVHAPFALTPVPFPKDAFMRAKNACIPFNSMIDAVSRDRKYLEDVLARAAQDDAEFTGKLMKIYKELGEEHDRQEDISLVITRSDYMLHEPTSRMLQVELNTIASSFGCLSTLVSQLHRYILERVEGGSGSDMSGRLPPNDSMQVISDGLAAAVIEHGHQDRTMMMVVQPDEQNSFDQQWLQFKLWDNHRIRTIRRTLKDIAERATLIESDNGQLLSIDGIAVSLAYFRAGYTPRDYPSNVEWDARRIVEKSNAAKCPTIGMQLAGSKKVQQDLARPGVVERYSASDSDALAMRACFAGLWGLDDLDNDKDASRAVEDAIKHPEYYVLKPQREGGGNNLYGEELRNRLSEKNDLGALVLMQRILPPSHVVTMVRRGAPQEVESLSELGIYGVLLRRGDRVLLNEEAGQLVRTKASTSSEGGVAAGYAVLDSVQLVD